MNIPYDLGDIQPRATQVRNCDEIGFDSNVRWNQVICTYRLFQGERITKVHNWERAPFWCTLLVFTKADGQCLRTPIILNQSKEYSQYIHLNIPLDWIFRHTQSGYMDREGWLKTMTKFSNICSAPPINNQILFYGHGSHFERWRTKTNGVQKHPTLCTKSNQLHQQPDQW